MLQARVERVAQPVAHEVDPEHEQEDGEAGEEGEPPGRRDVVAPSSSMDPQLGAGAGMPRPRNESDASAMIVRATENVATTVIGGSTLGSRWRRRIHPSPAPRARAAATKSRSRRASTSPRTMRA